jgi:hypothetical protein
LCRKIIYINASLVYLQFTHPSLQLGRASGKGPTCPNYLNVHISLPTDINECDRKSNPEYEKMYPCYGGSTCHNREGGYKCKCKFGLTGDGKRENGCRSILPIWAIPILGVHCSMICHCPHSTFGGQKLINCCFIFFADYMYK